MAFDYASKIQALLARAEHPNTGEHEARSARAMAEQLMVKYRIDEEAALATDADNVTVPIKRTIRLTSEYRGVIDNWYSMVFRTIARHTGVRHIVEWSSGGGEVAVVIGYEGDVRYTEFLWTAALLMFSTRIDPVWDTSLSEAENIWRLRNAGIERRVIADRAWGHGSGVVAANRSKVQRIYVRECTTRGEEVRAAGLGYKTEVYREAYARSFYETLRRRLSEARDAADSVRGGVVLHGRAERVDEAFYAVYPMLRPDPNPVPYVEPEPCKNCTPEKTCRAHSWTAADEKAWQRRHNSPSARAGQTSGRVAAEGVLIQRGHERPDRVERGSDRSAIEG
jgi:hypothetical protein